MRACLHNLRELFQDSGLRDHFRTFTRHPGIALGSSHKIHHPNASLSLTVQSSFLSSLGNWGDVEKMLILQKSVPWAGQGRGIIPSAGEGGRKGPTNRSALGKQLSQDPARSPAGAKHSLRHTPSSRE